nr:MAG TPA: hypothetical protein [Caudoviricetes sp.]
MLEAPLFESLLLHLKKPFAPRYQSKLTSWHNL